LAGSFDQFGRMNGKEDGKLTQSLSLILLHGIGEPQKRMAKHLENLQ
jgi:hypothetical protein